MSGKREGKPELQGIEELIARSKKGDSEAFGQLVRHFAPKAYGLALSFLAHPHDAEDASQEAFLRAFKNLGTFKPGGSFEAWLLTIVANLCRNKIRWRSLRIRWTSSLDAALEGESDGEPRTLDPPDHDRHADPLNNVEESNLKARMAEALGRLPAQQKTAVQLKFIEGYKITEIAELMKISEGTVKTHIFRGIEALKKSVPKEEESDVL